MSKVRVYRIRGRMLLSHDSLPEWREFNLEYTGTKIEDVIEKVYSNLGSRHKLRRKHIVIEEVKEVPAEETAKYTQDLLRLEGWSS